MAFSITERTRLKSESSNKTPNLVLEIDGVSTLYGLQTIKKYIRVGDPGLLIGNSWVIGGLGNVSDQTSNITFDGTSTSINQKLDQDKASGASISQMAIALVDINDEITNLISPGQVVTDILGRKAKVYLGFADTAWKEDYITIFKGIIDEINAGPKKITFHLSHPDQKKRQDIFVKSEAKTVGSITDTDTTIVLDSALNFLAPVLGPDGITYDSSIKYGVQIDNEIIFYTAKTGTNLTGCLRGQLGTTAAAHNNDADVTSFIELTGNAIDLALKIFFSGKQGPWVSNIDVTHINQLGDLTFLQNALFFDNVDMNVDYGASIGDYVTITLASNGANDVTRVITDIQKTAEGSYLILDGADLISENNSPAVISIRSQYDTLADGLSFDGDEVDISEHLRIKRLFLSSYEYDFYLKDTINGKDFIEQEIYFPAAAYSIPRKAASSLGYHIGPIPGVDVLILNDRNVKSPSEIAINRSINKNFYNTIIYKYEELPLEEKFIRGYITSDGTSEADIPIGTKALIIKSKGLRETLSGLNLATTGASRRLKRYKRGAEYISGFKALYGDTYNAEIGDIVVVDGATLKMFDRLTASRNGEPKLYEIVNKTLDIKTGGVVLDLVDTNYTTNSRYSLMSPASRIDIGATTTKFKVKISSNNPFGSNEGKKWSRYIGATIRVRSDDFTTRNDTSTILTVVGNVITLSMALSFTPQENDTITLSVYNDASDTLKLIYGWMRNTDPFGDGKNRYQMIG